MLLKNKVKLGAIFIALISPQLALSQNQFQDMYYGDGYTIINRSPIVTSDLNQTINKKIQANNIFNGLQQVLQGTGWRLAGYAAADPNITRLYEAGWPTIWDSYLTDSLVNVLQQIGGEGWQLVVDPVNRLISYEVRKGYR